MRSCCLYRGNYIDIADMYKVIEGKQINIPEKLKYYRQLSNTHNDLMCPCGCGEVVVLVAGSVRKQHFRLLKKFANSNCKYQEESDLSIRSKIVLKCWISKSLPEIDGEVTYRVPINELTDNKRRYELTLYIRNYNLGIVYYRLLENINADKINVQSEYLKTKILYVTSIENEFNDDQYPERMMLIQEKQGYCFYLALNSNMVYQDTKAKICVFMQDYKGYWKSVTVCEDFIDRYKLNYKGLIFYNGQKVTELVEQKKVNYIKKQSDILEQIRLAKEEQAKKDLRHQEEIQRLNEIERVKEQENLRKKAEEEQKHEMEKKKAEEESARKKEEELKKFLCAYPKLAAIYDLLSEIKSVKGSFLSDQSNGHIKSFNRNFEIQSVKIHMDNHIIEVVQDISNKAYFIVLEGSFTKSYRLGTGMSYAVLDYTRINNIEHHFITSFECVYKEEYKTVICMEPSIGCTHLNADRKCMYEKMCTYQGK